MNHNVLPALACGVALCLGGCSSSMGSDTNTSMASTAAPKLYVGLFGDNAVAVVDTSSYQILKTIAVPTGPHGLVITPDGAKVYVASDGSTVVSVISTSSDSVIATLDVGMTPHGLTISEDGSKVLLSDFGGNQAEIIDTATDKVTATIDVSRPHNSALSPDGNTAYEASQDATTPAMAVLDLTAAKVTDSITLQAAPRAVDYAPWGTVYFTLTGVDSLNSLDPKTNKLGTPIPTGGSPHHMLATKDGKYELVVSQTVGDLEFVDPTSATVVAKVPTGTTPHWIALSTDGKLAYVTDEGSNDVAVVDIAGQKVVQTISVGKGPRKIAVQPSQP